MLAFTKAVKEKQKLDKDKIDYNKAEGLFFDSENYKLLTEIVSPPVTNETEDGLNSRSNKQTNDPDYVMEPESELDLVEPKNKRKRGRSESDPVEPEVKRKRGGPTSLKPLSELLTEIVSKPVCFDSDTEEGVNPRSNKQTNDEHCQFTDFSFTFIFIHFEPYLLVIFFVKL